MKQRTRGMQGMGARLGVGAGLAALLAGAGCSAADESGAAEVPALRTTEVGPGAVETAGLAPEAFQTAAVESSSGAAAGAPSGWSKTPKLVATYKDFSPGLAYANGRVYSTSQYEQVLRVLDGKTGQDAGTVAVGRGPNRVLAEGDRLYVVNQWAQDLGDPFVSVVDTTPTGARVVRSLRVAIKREGSDPDNYPTTGFPTDVAVMDGKLFAAFPTNPIPNILPVTLSRWSEGRMFAAGSGPWRLAGVDGSLVVVNARGMGDPTDDAIAVLGPDGELRTRFETEGHLRDVVAVNGKGWVSRSLPDKEVGLVHVVDPRALTVGEIKVCKDPGGMTVVGTRIYVTCRAGRRVDVLDTATESVVDSIDLANLDPATASPRAVVVTDDGDLFVKSTDPSAGGLVDAFIHVVRRESDK
jgi:hypothetical protein